MAQILIVEDDPGIRGALIRGLTERGHAVDSAPTAMAGLEHAVGKRPDLVVLDLGLPDMDGTTMLRMLRGASTVPVIVATARDDETEIVSVLDAGADKPLAFLTDQGEENPAFRITERNSCCRNVQFRDEAMRVLRSAGEVHQ